MPAWWPLLQGNLDGGGWRQVERELGRFWPYVNVAVNPFTAPDMLDLHAEQITVAQLPVGLATGVEIDGTIKLAKRMKITGAGDGASYSLPKFTDAIGRLPTVPTLIILGPTQPDWSDDMNIERVCGLLEVLEGSCRSLWRSPRRNVYQEMWSLPA